METRGADLTSKSPIPRDLIPPARLHNPQSSAINSLKNEPVGASSRFKPSRGPFQEGPPSGMWCRVSSSFANTSFKATDSQLTEKQEGIQQVLAQSESEFWTGCQNSSLWSYTYKNKMLSCMSFPCTIKMLPPVAARVR